MHDAIFAGTNTHYSMCTGRVSTTNVKCFPYDSIKLLHKQHSTAKYRDANEQTSLININDQASRTKHCAPVHQLAIDTQRAKSKHVLDKL